MSKIAKYNHPGQPAYYDSPEEMQIIIDKFFNDCEGKPLFDDEGNAVLNRNGDPVMIGKRPPTVTGLALALGFHSRQSLINYSNKDQFLDTITEAKLRIQDYVETRLFDKEGSNGAKFSLSNNFGWIDRQVVDNNNNNHNTSLIDLSGFTINELKQLLASAENKLIEADYTATDE